MIVCAACGTGCPDGSRFCLSCGAPLAAHSHAAERKVVTAMFCDLVGFTALSEHADPEDADALLRSFNTLARDVVASFGGIVEKFIGDAVVAVFGVPMVREDDPERAVRAGLRLVQRIDELPGVDGRQVQVRVGVNTGRTLVRLDVDPMSGEGFLVGDAVNTAARLQSIAPPMGVVVGEVTHGLTERLFDYVALEPVALKGKAGPVSVWRAVGALARTGVGLRPAATGHVGREAELSVLEGRFEEAVEKQSPQMVLLVGEAGIGKSRLVYELARYADARPGLVTWRTGASLSYGESTPLWAFGEIVKAHAGILESDDRAEVECKLQDVLSESVEREWLAARLRPLLGLEAPAASPQENAAAWLLFIEDMARRRPTVLVFEDLQWADEGLLDFLGQLIDQTAEVPLLIIGVARPELLERRPGFAMPTARASRIEVRSLPASDAGELVHLLLADAGIDDGLRDAVVRRCGGNPLYAEEFVRLLADRRAAGREQVPGGDLDEALPDTLQALIAARLDVLRPDRKAILEDASVVGIEFWLGVLAAMGQADRETVDRELRHLATRDLVRPSPDSAVEGEPQYSFWHALTRDVAYEELPRAVRALKHADVAAWLEGGSGARLEDLAGVLAHHCVTALELARAAGRLELADRMLEPAVRALGMAGDRSLALDVAVAEGHYRRALELAAADSAQRSGLLTRWALALLEGGRIGDSLEVFHEGIVGLRLQGDSEATAKALSDYSTALELVGDMQSARRALEEALSLLDERGPSRALVDLLGHWAGYCTAMADGAEAVRAADRALVMASRLGLPTPARALAARAAWRCGSCDEDGFADYEVALAAAKAQGLGRETGVIYYNLGDDTATARGPVSALRRHEEGLRFARSRNDVAMSYSLALGVVDDLYRCGRWDEALEKAKTLAPQLEAARNFAELGYLTAVRAVLLVLRGDAEGASASLPSLEETGAGTGEPILRAENLVAGAHVRLALGEPGHARRLLAACAALTGLAEEYSFDWYVPGAVRDAAQLRDAALAERLAAIAVPGRPLSGRVAPTTRALLCELRGDAVGAAECYAAAAAEWGELGVPYELALARLGQGRCLMALGRASEAAAPLHEALDVLTELGAGPDIETARRLLARTGLS